MTDFLLELRSEEIPARMQVKAKEDLARLFADEIAKAGLTATKIETFATPRRLALIARGLPEQTPAVSEERKGPRSNAPEQALAGFLRSTGLTRDQLVERDGVFFAVIDKPGRPTAEVLAEAVPAVVRAFPWPKSMRWGDASLSTESLRWVRPLQGIVALFGETLVPLEVDGIISGAATMGHRFHHSGAVTIESADTYVEQLRAAHVIVHLSERTTLIRDGARAAAAAEGLVLVEDEGLVLENAGLTEWPVPLLGRFDPDFLGVPREVIQLTMRTNQKYFACTDADGELANAFVCTANLDATDGGKAIVAGNRKVLAARLSDAKFFWENDLKISLATQAEKLSGIVFHEKLGTVADKVERVAKLARWLVESGVIKPSPLQGRGLGEAPSASATPDPAETALPLSPTLSPEGEREGLAQLAETAARLCKADLVTGMVGEFPELQGIIGGHLARAQGLPDAVADAISASYTTNPDGPVGLALGLADRLDTLSSFFRVDIRPTGSRDPFALRRAGLAVIFLLLAKGLRIELGQILQRGVIEFLIDRWKFQNREAGSNPTLIDAVVAVSDDTDLFRLGLRMRALEDFIGTDEGTNLLAGYKRAANILKKESASSSPSPLRGEGRGERASEASTGSQDSSEVDPHPTLPLQGEGYEREPAEAALIAALDTAEPLAAAAIEAEDFESAMSALATLRTPIDAFFETVTVNDPDPARRTARLALLARFRDAVHRVADFSKIEG